MVLLAILVRLLVVGKWVVAQEWLTSPLSKPPLLDLAVRILGGAAVFGLEATFIFQRGCFDLTTVKFPGQLCAFFLFLAVCRALHMAAELRMLQLTSTMLLGFLHPFRYVAMDILGVYASQDGSLPTVQLVGVALCVVAGIGYQQTASFTMRPVSKDYAAFRTREFHKTITIPGDGIHFPKKGENVKIRFCGWLSDTLEHFDSGFSVFQIGTERVIKGMDAGIMSMSLGEAAVLKIPAAYAYGDAGMHDIIPPRADLTFEVQLIKLGCNVGG
jgi:hypothetical protein